MPLVPIVIVLAALAVAALVMLIRWAVRREREAHERTLDEWRRLAEHLGGRFHPASGPWYRRRGSRVSVAASDVNIALDTFGGAGGREAGDVVLDTYVVHTGQVVLTYTRARVEVPSSHSCSISAEHALSGIGKKLGLQDIETGDAAHDEAFIVKADDEHWLRRALGPEVRGLHLRHPELALTLKKGELTVVKQGMVSDPEVLRGMMGLAAAGARAFA